MPGLPGVPSSPTPTPKAEVKSRDIEIVFQDCESVAGGGYTLAYCGKSNTGKSDSAITLGHMQKKNAALFRSLGMTFLADALEQDLIPEVKKIILIESENAYIKQKDRIKERSLYGELRPMIKHYTIDSVSKDEATATDGGTRITAKSIEDIQTSAEKYSAAIDAAKKLADANTLVILDSASRYKLLLDIKADMIETLRNEGKGEEGIKSNSIKKWQNRNGWWMRSMTVLRGMPGWVVCTFMDEDVADFVQDMQKKSGKKVQETKREWAPKTAFNFDIIYNFTRDTPTSEPYASLESSRYPYAGDPDEKGNLHGEKYNEICLNNKYAILWMIEGMLRGNKEA